MEGSPPEITVRVGFETTISPERVPDLLQFLGRIANRPLTMEAQIANQQLEMFEVGVRDQATEVVTQGAFRDYYMHSFAVEKPSSLPTRVFHQVTHEVDDEALVRDEKGNTIGVKRTAFDDFVNQQRSGSEIAITGKQSRALLFGVSQHLPPVPE